MQAAEAKLSEADVRLAALAAQVAAAEAKLGDAAGGDAVRNATDGLVAQLQQTRQELEAAVAAAKQEAQVGLDNLAARLDQASTANAPDRQVSAAVDAVQAVLAQERAETGAQMDALREQLRAEVLRSHREVQALGNEGVKDLERKMHAALDDALEKIRREVHADVENMLGGGEGGGSGGSRRG